MKNFTSRVPGTTLTMQKRNMLANVWFDKRKVAVLSTCQNPGNRTILRPRAQGNRPRELTKPIAIVNYNSYMGGVDLADQLRSYYPIGRESKKWWKYLFWFVIESSVVNAFIIYSETLPGQLDDDEDAPPKLSHLMFRLQVAKMLVGGFSGKKRAGRKSKSSISSSLVAEANIGQHTLVKIEGRKRVCVQCSAVRRKTPAGRGIETSYRCKICNVALCQKRGCFAEFHHQHMA